MAKHLEDIGKDAKDLLIESYPNDGTVKFTAQTKALNFTPKIVLNRSSKREKGGVKELVSATFDPKYEVKEHNLEFNGKLTSSYDLNVGASVRDFVGHGSKVELNLSRSERDGLHGISILSYKSDLVAVKGKFTYPLTPKKPTKVNSEIVLHHGGSHSNVGVGVDIILEDNIAQIFTEAVVAHTDKDTQYKGFARYDVYESKFNCGFSLWQKWSERCNWAFDILLEDYFAKTSFTAGSECKCDDSTTVKGKWKVTKTKDRLDYRVGASLKQKVSPHIIATLGADLNPRSFFVVGQTTGDGEPHSFGLDIKFQE